MSRVTSRTTFVCVLVFCSPHVFCIHPSIMPRVLFGPHDNPNRSTCELLVGFGPAMIAVTQFSHPHPSAPFSTPNIDSSSYKFKSPLYVSFSKMYLQQCCWAVGHRPILLPACSSRDAAAKPEPGTTPIAIGLADHNSCYRTDNLCFRGVGRPMDSRGHCH